MRTLEGHKVNPANDVLTITVQDEPGAGGASHLYMIQGFNTRANPSDPFVKRHGSPAEHATILFQNGPIAEAGVNGITHEALLEILIDRITSFQKGTHPSRENAIVLTHLQEAQMWLQKRTRERIARGVEGTSAK